MFIVFKIIQCTQRFKISFEDFKNINLPNRNYEIKNDSYCMLYRILITIMQILKTYTYMHL